MNNDLKIYDYSQFQFFLSCFMVIFALIVSIFIFFHPNNFFKILSIGWLLLSLLWLGHVFYEKNNPYIAITRDLLFISKGPYQKNLQIKISNIENIERISLTKIRIWYRDKNNNIKNYKLMINVIRKEKQIEFNKFIENIKLKKISPAVSN